MHAEPAVDLSGLLALPLGKRIGPLTTLAQTLVDRQDAGDELDTATRDAVVQGIIDLINACAGTGKERLALGEALGRLGDPRLRSPSDAEYWSTVAVTDGDLLVGRYPVTTAEWQEFARSGGYERDELWSPEGLAWRGSGVRLWPELATRPAVAHLIIPHQPVVGVTWHEANAYAKSQGARLLTFSERLDVVRGREKRPYPWGEPFGQGNANTAEEVLEKPSAIGLYISDRTPEGVSDLAGNVAEWTADEMGDERVIAPGSWKQVSMAAWAKARHFEPPDARQIDLGFRICRDL